jgi:hypothetical protein
MAKKVSRYELKSHLVSNLKFNWQLGYLVTAYYLRSAFIHFAVFVRQLRANGRCTFVNCQNWRNKEEDAIT